MATFSPDEVLGNTTGVFAPDDVGPPKDTYHPDEITALAEPQPPQRSFLSRVWYGATSAFDKAITSLSQAQAAGDIGEAGSDVPAEGQDIFSPGFSLPRTGAPGTIQRGISETVGGIVEGALSPGGTLLAAGSFLPGGAQVIGGTMAGLAAKEAGRKLGEASVTGNRQTATEGIGQAILAPAMAYGAVKTPATPVHQEIAAYLQGFEGKLKQLSGETMPMTTVANREAGEAGARYGSAQIYGAYAARAMGEEVLPASSGIDPNLFGAALTEHNLRGRRTAFQREANAKLAEGNLEEAERLQDMANNVSSVVGERGAFVDEASLREFTQQPEVQDAVKRLDDLYAQRIDPLAEQAGLDPTQKPETGNLFPGAIGFINLFVPEEGGVPAVKTTRGVNPLATMKKGTKFQLQRTGAAERYGTNFHDMVANAYSGFLEVARKNEFDKTLTDAGLAVISDEKPGPEFTSFPYERNKVLGLENGDIVFRASRRKNIWVRNDLAQEYEIVSNMAKNPFGKVTSLIAGKAITRFQMLGVLDAAYHTRALVKGLGEAPMAGTLTDPVWSGLLRSDLIPKTKKLMDAFFLDPLERADRLAELANIGALSAHQPYSWEAPIKSAVRFTEENVRLALSDIFDDLAKDGKFPATETAKREFVNRGLQYNMRFQGPVMRALRQTAIGPFVTAGRAGLARGLRRYAFMDWAEPTDVAARTWVAANVASKAAGTAAVVGLLNYLQTDSFTGREGTPLGNVDTGMDDENGAPLSVALADMLGNEVRGGKALGLRAFATSQMQELDPTQTIESMVKESANTFLHPGLGPLPQSVYGALTGKQIGVGLPDYPRVAPGEGESQILSNVRVAAEHLNPLLVGLAEQALGHEPEKPPGEGTVSALGIVKGTKPERFENMAKIVTGGQVRDFADWVATGARKLPLSERRGFLLEQKDRIEDPTLQRQYQHVLERLHPSLLKRE